MTEKENYCIKCGAPRSNHPYRHMFVGPLPPGQTVSEISQAEIDKFDALIDRVKELEAALMEKQK